MKTGRKKVQKQTSSQKRKSYPVDQGIITETIFKLVFSSIIAAAAIVSFSRLLPYHLSQKAKLQEVRAQVQETKRRVDILRSELHRSFDSQQTQMLMEEYSPSIAPNRSRVFWESESTQQTQDSKLKQEIEKKE